MELSEQQMTLQKLISNFIQTLGINPPIVFLEISFTYITVILPMTLPSG